MKTRTVKELRAAAKARGIKGYSRLSREALLRVLEASDAAAADASSVPAAGAPAPASAPGDTGSAAQAPGRAPDTTAPQPPGPAPIETGFASTEQLVEDAKYALRPPGAPTVPAATDLDEDIERLPELTEAVVVLLPQKPDILHAYWVLPPGETARHDDYTLRLARTAGETVDVRQEVPVDTERGSWYFHLPPESAEGGDMLVQLGYYDDGRFVGAGGRSSARLPTLYASTRTDRRWWIEEAEFMRMYVRAGGFIAPGQRFGWAASIGSPGPGIGPEQHLAWPGGVSSPTK